MALVLVRLIILLMALLSGCVTQPVPMPAPTPTNFCAEGQTKDCIKWTSSEKNGLGGRGHGEYVEEKP